MLMIYLYSREKHLLVQYRKKLTLLNYLFSVLWKPPLECSIHNMAKHTSNMHKVFHPSLLGVLAAPNLKIKWFDWLYIILFKCLAR